MSGKVLTYKGDAIVVRYDVKRCIHAGECVNGHRGVFDPDRKPWIDAGAAAADQVAEVIHRCPSGALTYERVDDGAAEPVPADNVARADADGPLYVRGNVRIALPGGETVEMTRVALCRCGASANKPFCDNSHIDAGFADPGVIQGGRLVPTDEDDGGAVTLTGRPNGPLLVQGPLTFVDQKGTRVEGRKGAFCRCGGSSTKPFCDGTHKENGFVAD